MAIKVWTELRPELRPELTRQIPAHGNANLPAELRNYGPRVRKSIPRRLLDEIWRRDRKNEHRVAEKPILCKTASRTDETATG